MNNRYKKLGENTLLMAIGSFGPKIITFLLVPLYTYVLTTEEYGTLDLITTTVSLLIPLLTLVAQEAILRFTLDENIDKKTPFSISMYIIAGSFILLLLFSPLIYKIVPFKDYYVVFCIYYLLTSLSTNLSQFTKGLGHVPSFVFSGILQTASVALLNILFLLVFKFGILGYVSASIIGALISILYLCIHERIWHYLIKFTSISKKQWKEWLDFCIPLVPNSLSWWISNSSDKFILQFFWNSSVVGIYAIAYKIPTIINVFSTIFNSAWQISAVDDFGSKESISFISKLYDRYSSLYVVGTSFVVVSSQFLASILFSKDFFSAWPFSVVLTLGVMFQSMASFLGVIYTTAKRTKMIFTTTMIGAVGNIILNIILIPSMGAFGAAIATLFSYFIVWLIRYLDILKKYSLEIDRKKIAFSYGFLFIEAFFVCIQNVYTFGIAILIVVFLIVAERKTITDLLYIVMKKHK